MSTAPFRQYLYAPDSPRLANVRGMDAYQYREAAKSDDFTGDLIKGWTPLYLNDFVGVTENGTLREGLYPLTPAPAEEAAPVPAMVEAAEALLSLLSDDDRSRVQHAVDAPEWQTWANPEFMQFDTGLRLEFQSPAVREAALDLVKASLSPAGYALTHDMMLINGFLGEVIDLKTILNEFSYNIALFGTPDLDAPWGWQLFGHHCAVNCLVVEGRMVVSPIFHGAEPNEIDEGPHRGTTAFEARITAAINLMAALTPEQRAAATMYEQMVDPSMPPGRVHPGDERHLAGAFQDNRVIPFEGVSCVELSQEARDMVVRIIEQFVEVLPDGPRTARMREVAAHLDETYLSWIGGHEPGDVFYYRLQSPVIIVELDHHCGVFLDYDEPQPFHIHTVLRTPHGNDYGRALVRQWQEAQAR